MFQRVLTTIAAAAMLIGAVTTGAASPALAYPPGCAVVTTNASSYAPGATITITAQGAPADEGALVTFTVTLTGGGPIEVPSLRVVPQGHGLGFSGVVARPQSSTTTIVVTAVADADGVAVVTITAPLTVGDYTVTITNISCGDASSSFVVQPDNPTTTTPTGTTIPGRVPAAGSNTEPWLVAATALVVVGLMLWVATRRRRRASHA